VPRFQGFRVPRSQGSKVPGFQGSRVPGFQGSRVPGFQGFRVPFRILKAASPREPAPALEIETQQALLLGISQRQIGGKASLNRSKLSKQLRKQLENVRKFAEGIEPGNPIWSPAPSRHSGTL
jgi:hypothetical protein